MFCSMATWTLNIQGLCLDESRTFSPWHNIVGDWRLQYAGPAWVCLFNLTRRGLTFDSRLHDISWTFIKDRENCQRNCSKISTGCCPHFVDLPDFCILLKKPPRAKGRPPLSWLPSFYCQKLDKLLQHPGSGHLTKSNWIWSRKGRIWLEASTLPIHLVPGILRKSVSI